MDLVAQQALLCRSFKGGFRTPNNEHFPPLKPQTSMNAEFRDANLVRNITLPTSLEITRRPEMMLQHFIGIYVLPFLSERLFLTFFTVPSVYNSARNLSIGIRIDADSPISVPQPLYQLSSNKSETFSLFKQLLQWRRFVLHSLLPPSG
jgi:hypothetical protein